MEKERDEAKQESRPTQLVATTVGDAKARVEVNLTKALNSLAAVEEGGGRSKAKVAYLEAEFAHIEAEQASLLLELEASKREVPSLLAQASKDRKDMVEGYQGVLDLIFSYGYGVAYSRTTSTGISQTSRMACLILPTLFLQNFLTTQGAPQP